MRYLTLFLLLTVSFVYSQEKTQAPEKPAGKAASTAIPFKDTVQKMADEWLAGFQSKDADKIAAMYTDDAVWINAEGTFHGGDIKGELKKMIDGGDTVTAITTTRAVHHGNLAWAEGTYTGTVPNPKGGEAIAGNGSWVTTLKNINGKWMLATHTSVPAPAPKTAAKVAK